MSRILLADPDGTGGLATHVSLLAEGLVARGHDVDVHVGWSQAPRASEHEASGATLRMVPSLVELIASETFDVVNISDNALVHLRPKTLRRSPSPIVVTVHSERWNLDVRGADAVVLVAPGQVIRRWRPASALRDALVIRNPVALDRFTIEGPRCDLGDRPVVAWIGRPSHAAKGVDLFVEVARELGSSFQPLIIAEATHIDGARKVLEALPHAKVTTRAWRDMPTLLRGVGATGGCVLMTSNSESDPLVVGEALACGVPVVSSKIGGIEDWIPTGGVSTFDADRSNAAILGAAAVTETTSRGRSDGHALALRQTVPTWRTPPVWLDSFEAVYESLPPRTRARNRTPRTATPSPARLKPGVQRVGVAMVTFARPDAAQRCLTSIASLGQRVTSVCVVNNDPTTTIDHPQSWPTEVDLQVINLANNEGLPAALGRAFDALQNCDAILILDDDTMISPEIFDDLRTTLRDGTGIAAATTPFCDQMSPYDQPLLFPWSPSLLRREALENVGNPHRGLFFGHDDYDFALRLHRAGWRVGTTTVPIPDRRLDTPWPERRYFGLRNALWLATRQWRRSPVFWRILGRELHDTVRSSGRQLWRRHDIGFARRETRAALVGITHGIAGRIGPPPPWVLAGRGTVTQTEHADRPWGGGPSVPFPSGSCDTSDLTR